MNRLLILFVLIVIFVNPVKSQYYQTGQDPASLKWRQINTSNFQVVYPEDFENQAQRISYVLSKVYAYGTKTLNHSPKRISVILHTRTIESNGLMAWAPKRMEFFTTPNQQIYAQDWLEQLALHEFRHLVQMDKVQSELPLLLKIILGEQAAAVVVGAYLPLWFMEGDAVVAETALSKTGRGRMASFSMDYRALLVEKGRYSYDKAYLGSYKDYVPNYYKLGYFMVGKSREEYGMDIWSNTLDRVGKYPLSLTPLNNEFKKTTGLSIKKVYEKLFDELKNEWTKKKEERSADSCKVVSPVKNKYVEYLYPEFYHDSIIFAYRTSLDDIGRFVLIYPDRTEKVLFTPGTILKESVSLRDNLIIWAEQQANLRWPHADCSVIKLYNIETGRRRSLKPENKLFSPTVSPDLKTFAAVEIDKKNQFSLSVFDLETGQLKERYNTPDNQFFINPCWDEKGDRIYAISLSSQGKCLISIDIKSNQISRLTEYTFANLKNPVYSKGRIFFSSDFSGIDNLYSLSSNGKIYQEVSLPFGGDYPAVSPTGNQLLFCNYTSGGYQLSCIDIRDSIIDNQVKELQLANDSLAQNLACQEIGVPEFSGSDSVKYQSKKYSKLGNMFNIHSWAPAYINVNSYDIRPGVSVFSQNKLGTASTSLGYDYNVTDRTGDYKLEFTYSGLFPEFKVELSVGDEASSYFQITNTVNKNNQIIKRDTILKRLVCSEFTADLDIRLPLNLSKGKYSRILYPEFKYTFNQVFNANSAPTGFYSGNYHAFDYRIYFHNLLHQSLQNIIPRWGEQIDVIYRHTPVGNNDLGTLYGVQSVVYLPGGLKNTGFKIYNAYQGKSFTHNYSFSNFIKFPRGLPSYQTNKLYSFAIDYKFPICYPDLSINALCYVKRIRSSLFYDYSWLSAPTMDKNRIIYPNTRKAELKSMGAELNTDLHFLRFFAPIVLGFRTIYNPDYKSVRCELLFSVSFSGL